MSERYDAVVVGAGLAGLECARTMAQAGLSVLLADQKPAVDHAVHTTGIFVRRTLDDFALPGDCLGPPVRRVVVYSPRGRPLALESGHDEFRVGKMGALYRRRLDDALRAGAEWSPRSKLTGVADDGEGSCVFFDVEGSPRVVRTRFVIGADGAASRVAPLLGLDENR